MVMEQDVKSEQGQEGMRFSVQVPLRTGSTCLLVARGYAWIVHG